MGALRALPAFLREPPRELSVHLGAEQAGMPQQPGGVLTRAAFEHPLFRPTEYKNQKSNPNPNIA